MKYVASQSGNLDLKFNGNGRFINFKFPSLTRTNYLQDNDFMVQLRLIFSDSTFNNSNKTFHVAHKIHVLTLIYLLHVAKS